MKAKSPSIILALALIFVAGSAFAQTWQRVNPPPGVNGPETNYYGPIRMSAEGVIMCAVPANAVPVISTNSGAKWAIAVTEGDPCINLGGVAVSADGSRIYAVLAKSALPGTEIMVATNRGSDWRPAGFPDILSWGLTNNSIACSADGTKVIAAYQQGPILYSTNGGANCYTSSVAPANWTSLACSASGGRMIAAADGGSIYFSEDFGASWTPTNLPAQAWTSVCISANGKSIGATSSTHSYISADSGVTWLTNDFAGLSIACSADGRVWLITSTQVEISTDGGHTWQANLSPAQWSGGAVSADGNLMAVMGTGQGTWIGSVTPSPQLNIQWQDPNVFLSWLTPSTNFVLQQTTDLASPNWTPVATTPTLNFTTLNQQVTVPANGSNAFFRLSAQ